MINTIDDNWIMKNVTKIISSFLANTLPPDKAEVHLTPNLPYRVQSEIITPADLQKTDLYCNLRVLIYNDRFFRDNNVFEGGTINSCARLVLSYRNRLAHPKYEEIVSLEHMQLEYISINRLISLLPTQPELQELIEKARTYIGSILVFLAKEYYNSEIATSKKIELHIQKGKSKNDENSDYGDTVFTTNDVRISISECKQQLRAVRGIIQKEIKDLPGWANILRESILEQIVEQKITTKQQFTELLPDRDVAKTDERQFRFFDKISDVISRL